MNKATIKKGDNDNDEKYTLVPQSWTGKADGTTTLLPSITENILTTLFHPSMYVSLLKDATEKSPTIRWYIVKKASAFKGDVYNSRLCQEKLCLFE